MEILPVRKKNHFGDISYQPQVFFNQPDLNVRQSWWLAFLSEFEFDIKHIKRKENKIAYALSRHTHALMVTTVSGDHKDFLEQIQKAIEINRKYLEIQHKLQQTEILGYVENSKNANL